MSRSNSPNPNDPPDDGVPPASSEQFGIEGSWELYDPRDERQVTARANRGHNNAETDQDDGQVNGEPVAAMAEPESSAIDNGERASRYAEGVAEFDGIRCEFDSARRDVARQESPKASRQTGGVGWPDFSHNVEDDGAGIDPYPIDSLPDLLREGVLDSHRFTKAPIALHASSAISVAATVVQGHVDIVRMRGKSKHPDGTGKEMILKGPTSLFFLTVADSGERKSSVDGHFSRPIEEYEAEQAAAMKEAVSNYKADLRAWTARVNRITRAIGKEEDPEKRKKLEAENRAVEKERPKQPRVPKILVSDSTTEGLSKRLDQEWPVAGAMVAEGGTFFGGYSMRAEQAMANFALYNVLWDGRKYRADRKQAESIEISNARVSIGVQIQSATLNEFLRSQGELARGIGFLARFLLAVPESTQGTRFIDPNEDLGSGAGLSAFHDRLRELLNRNVPLDGQGQLKPVQIGLTPEAETRWINLHNEVEAQLSDAGRLCNIRDAASKIADNAVRMATVFHVFESGSVMTNVGLDMMDRACDVTLWHLHEARRFFLGAGVPSEVSDANELGEWLVRHCRDHGVTEVPKSVALQRGPRRLRSKKRLDPTVAELVERGSVRYGKRDGKVVIEVHPALIKGKA